jgi:glycerate-2-kinase
VTVADDAADHLDRNDARTAFDAFSDAVNPDPRIPNVNDFQAILVR